MTEHNLEVGERVGVWSRPADDVIYMFGYGRYIGSANINGTTFPAVTFDLEPGQEYVLRYSNIWYGRQESIKSTLSEFEGKIYKMTLTEFLAEDFKPPEGQKTTGGAPTKDDGTPKPPREETAFDIMYRLGSEVKKALSRVQIFEMSIVELQTSIKEKRTEMAALKSQALSDLDAIERGETIATSKPKEPIQPAPRPEPEELCNDEQPATLPSNACEVCDGVPGACACS